MTQTRHKTRYCPLWYVTIAGPPHCPVWCHLDGIVYRRDDPETPKMAEPYFRSDGRFRSLVSYSSFLVTICLSRLVSEIFACDRWTDNVNHYYSWPHNVAGQLIKLALTQIYKRHIQSGQEQPRKLHISEQKTFKYKPGCFVRQW